MRRLVENNLIRWKDSSRRKPLVIRGARQVGKSWLVENFLAANFNHFAKIDLEARRDLHGIFEGNLDPKKIVKELEFDTGRITPGRSLLFLDEIQACPRAITSLRYFYEQMPELHVVAAGSLLEFAMGETSVPVGRLQYLYLYPMTFFEYLVALGRQEMADSILRSPFELSETQQRMISEELRDYFLVGGMPEAVHTFRDTHSIVEANTVQSEILNTLRDDFHKYSPKVDPACLDEVFLNIARSVGTQVKYSRLGVGFSYQTNHKAFDLLVKALLVHRIPNCDPSGVPLGATADLRRFKAVCIDIGLLQNLCQVRDRFETDLIAIYRGRLAEQFVAQELITWHNPSLFYWSRNVKNSSAEIDYLAIKDGSVYPVEVKSGSAGKFKSLHMILEKYPNFPRGFVLHDDIAREAPEYNLTYLPLFSTPFLGDRGNIEG